MQSQLDKAKEDTQKEKMKNELLQIHVEKLNEDIQSKNQLVEELLNELNSLKRQL